MRLTFKLKRNISGYLTVFLALILAALLPLCLTLIEGARIRAIYFEAECVADIGINSIFAEYHRELLEQYNIFAIDSSYGTIYSEKANTEQHLKKYLEKNMSFDDIFLSDFIYRDFMGLYMNDAKLTKLSYLSDYKGEVFRRCAVDAIRNDVGLEALEQLKEWLSVVESESLNTRNVGEEKHALDEKIERLVDEAQSDDEEEIVREDGTIEIVKISYPPYESPTELLEVKRREGVLKYVVENTDELSDKILHAENLIISRMKDGNISMGNIPHTDISLLQQAEERFFFQEYLLRYMDYYGKADYGKIDYEKTDYRKGDYGEFNYEKTDHENALEYQIEYLIAGNISDIDNLRSVANRLCLMREAANAVYIFSDETKCAEAELLATIIAALVQAPDIEPFLKDSILFGWAYAESLYDLKTLLSGGKVPLIKDAETWHYSLHGALDADAGDAEGFENGLSYSDYLRIFMYLTDEDTLTARAMNLVEADLRLTEGNKAFRLDACIPKAEIKVQIDSSYGYSCEVIREKSY